MVDRITTRHAVSSIRSTAAKTRKTGKKKTYIYVPHPSIACARIRRATTLGVKKEKGLSTQLATRRRICFD